MKIHVVVNPKAGAGAALRRLPAVRRALAEAAADVDVARTEGPGDAARLAARARDAGAEIVVAVGGDGTLNELAQAYVGPDGEPVGGPALALVPAGTGGDFRRTLRIPEEPGAAVRRLLASEGRAVDLGVLQLTGHAGEPLRRAFVNIASFGVSGEIDRLVNAGPKWLGGRTSFAWGTLRAMTTYRNAPVAIRLDGADWYEGHIVVAALANGRYFGGGMKIAPAADPSDGLLDVVVAGDLGFSQALGLAPSLYRGGHVGHASVKTGRAREVEARALGRGPVLVDADGEAPGRLALHARLLPGALRFRA